MAKVEQQYLDDLIKDAYTKISEYINQKNIQDLVNEHFVDRINNDKQKRFIKFHEYYFNTLNNDEAFMNPGFFMTFRHMYSLRGVSHEHIAGIEKEIDKRTILQLIRQDRLSELYPIFTREKHFGSFFTKLVHTFSPLKYCPVDNPIKKYFKLEHESFFIALIVISRAYHMWTINNPELMVKLKKEFVSSDITGHMRNNVQLINEMKLLNIIFWSLADKLYKDS